MAEKLTISGLRNGGEMVLSGIESLNSANRAPQIVMAGIRPGH
jgi:hypothetical protein